MRYLNDEYLHRLSPSERSLLDAQLSSWGKDDRFFDVIDDWFNNFQTREDKELAFRVFQKIDYYSAERFQQRVRQHKTSIEIRVRQNQPDFTLPDALFVYAGGEADSSQRHTYDLTKIWELPRERVIRLEDLNEATTAPVVILFNDTHGSGNQFVNEVWPSVSKACPSSQIFVICIALAEEAEKRLRTLSPAVQVIPAMPTPSARDLFSASDLNRLEQLGHSVYPKHPLGYGGCALLTAYYFQCPNNSLPIIWADGTNNASAGRPGFPWRPLFPYYPKIRERAGSRRSSLVPAALFDPRTDRGAAAIAALQGPVPKSVLQRLLVERNSKATVERLKGLDLIVDGEQPMEAEPADKLRELFESPDTTVHRELADFLEPLIATIPIVLAETIRQRRMAGDQITAAGLLVGHQVQAFNELPPNVIIDLAEGLDVDTGQDGKQTELHWQLVAIREAAKFANGQVMGVFNYLEEVIPASVSNDCHLRLAAVSLNAEISRSTNYESTRFARLRLTVVDLLKEDVSSDGRAWALSALGRLYLRQGHASLVTDTADQLLRLPGTDRRMDLQARAWLLKAEAIQHAGDRANGREQISSALTKAWQCLSLMKNPAPHRSLRATVLRHQAMLAASEKHFKEALRYAEAGLTELQGAPQSTAIAWQYHNVADILARRSFVNDRPPDGSLKLPADCIEALVRSRRIFRIFKGPSKGGSEGVAYSYLMIGRWYAEIEDNKRAFKYLGRAKKHADIYGIANVQREANAELAALLARIMEMNDARTRAHSTERVL